MHLAALPQHPAGIARNDSGDDFHKSGLARAVLAQQQMHFARLDGERTIAEGGDTAVSFLDVAEFQEHGKATSLPHTAGPECLLRGKCKGLRAKKEKVPSDPHSSRAPHRHARSKASQTRPPDVNSSAPRLSLLSRNGSTLPSPPAAPSCSELTPRSGLSLTHGDRLFPSPRCEIDAPGRLLRRRTGTEIEPVRPTAPPLDPVCPGPGGIYAIDPLPDFTPVPPAATGFPLPSGDGYIPYGSQRSIREPLESSPV